MSDENEVVKPAAESTPAAVVPDESDTPESSTGAGETQVAPPAADGAEATGSPASESGISEADLKKTTRESLIAQLTGVDEEEPEEPEAPAAAPAAETPSADTAPDASAAAETPKPGDLTDADLAAPKDAKPAQQRRWNKLLDDRKAKVAEITKLQPLATYGQSMLELARDARLAPENLGAWLALAKEVNADPKKAPLRFLAEAENLAKQLGVELPARTVQVPSGPDPKLLDEIDEMLVDKVMATEITADTAKALRAKIKALRTLPPPAAPPAPQVQTSFAQSGTATPAPAQTQASPAPRALNAAENTAVAEIGKLRAGYAKQYPTDWAKIESVVQPAMARYRGTQPSEWPAFFKDEVEKAKAKLAATQKKSSVPTQTLRPTSTAASNKQTVTGRAKMLGELTGKKT